MENVEHAVAVGALRSAGDTVVIVSFPFGCLFFFFDGLFLQSVPSIGDFETLGGSRLTS